MAKDWAGITEEDATNDSCGINSNWFCIGNKNDVLGGCVNVGQYCDTFVWVKPCFRNELSKLVLTILAYAVEAPAEGESEATVKVTLYLDADGSPTSVGEAEMQLEAEVPEGVDPSDTRELLGLPELPMRQSRSRAQDEIDPLADNEFPLDIETGAFVPMPASKPEKFGPEESTPERPSLENFEPGERPALERNPNRKKLTPEDIEQLRKRKTAKPGLRLSQSELLLRERLYLDQIAPSRR